MIDIQAIGLEVLAGMRQLEYNDDREKYLTEHTNKIYGMIKADQNV